MRSTVTPNLEFKQGAIAYICAAAYVVAGIILVIEGTFHFATPSSTRDTKIFLSVGLFALVLGLPSLFRAINARVLIEPEGLVLKNGLGKVSARLPWDAIQDVRLCYRRRSRRYYLVTAASNSYEISGYPDLDNIATNIIARCPNLNYPGNNTFLSRFLP
jgi:hypothetical protein